MDKIIKDGSTGEIVEKKSRFICELRYVETEEEAENFIKEKKKQYHDARHNCSCYIVGSENPIKKSSDDGEPSGTAGRPMLEVIEGEGIYNIACVVTRYFGGVLLGTGGLVRAYQAATKEALENARILSMITVEELLIEVDYNNWGKLDNLFRDEGIIIDNIDYAENVKVVALVPVEKSQKIYDKVVEMTCGKVTAKRGDVFNTESVVG